MLKGNKGITLVALIITIIVLLILAGVSISFVLNGGVVQKSVDTVNAYKNSATNENAQLDAVNTFMDQKWNEYVNGK